MGKLKEIVQSVDQAKDVEKEIKEALNLLYELSKEKAKSYENEIKSQLRTAGTPENPTAPITIQLGEFQEIRVVTSKTSNEDIIKGIGEALKDVLTGSKDGIINGLSSLINKGLNAVLGASEGEERFEHNYYIATEGLSIVRLDLIYWSRHITAQGITKYAEKSLVCVAVKSSVDLQKIDFNAFLASYQAQLIRCDYKPEELFEELQNAKRIYNLLTGKADGMLKSAVNGISNHSIVSSNESLFKVQKYGNLKSETKNTSGIWPS